MDLEGHIVELTQLRYFQTAAYYQHISRAAEELNISQPALSTMISRLEKELGVPLFDHNGRSIILNQNGQRFLQRVNHILMEVENSKRELQDIADEGDNSISLAVSSSQFLQGMHAFMYQHPNYKWNQRVAENKEIAALLNRGQIDLAVTSPVWVGESLKLGIGTSSSWLSIRTTPWHSGKVSVWRSSPTSASSCF